MKEQLLTKGEFAFVVFLLTLIVCSLIGMFINHNTQIDNYIKGYNQGYVDAQLDNIENLKDAFQENTGIDYFDLNKKYEISCNVISYRRLK